MTQAELFEAWQRFAHRADLSADMETIWTLAAERISERLFRDPDLDELLQDAPRMLLHAGLFCIHELAQDDEGMMREDAIFGAAVQDYAMRESRTRNGTVDPFSYQG